VNDKATLTIDKTQALKTSAFFLEASSHSLAVPFFLSISSLLNALKSCPMLTDLRWKRKRLAILREASAEKYPSASKAKGESVLCHLPSGLKDYFGEALS
jgi:hypothetical protein